RRRGLPPARSRRADAALRGHYDLRVDGGRAEAHRRSGRRAQSVPRRARPLRRGLPLVAARGRRRVPPRRHLGGAGRRAGALSPRRVWHAQGGPGMNFATPAYVLLTTLFIVPIAIHLIGRSRAKVRRFAAIELLLRGEKRVATRTKIRQWLLLLLR